MGSIPDLMFVIDTNREAIAIHEAQAASASRSSRSSIRTAIRTASTTRSPATTTRSRAISLYCDLIARAAIDGIARQQGAMGVDVGASAEAPVEPALDETAPA
jgi:small subunit ribosomal protein S2